MSKRKNRNFLISFTFNDIHGFGFGNWIIETDGGFVNIDDAKEYAENLRIEKEYKSVLILAISEINA